jgi:hypothetical protein
MDDDHNRTLEEDEIQQYVLERVGNGASQAGGSRVFLAPWRPRPTLENRCITSVWTPLTLNPCGPQVGRPLSDADLAEGMRELDPLDTGHADFDAFSRWYIVKHAEPGQHSGVLQLIEAEMEQKEKAQVSYAAVFHVVGARCFLKGMSDERLTRPVVTRAPTPHGTGGPSDALLRTAVRPRAATLSWGVGHVSLSVDIDTWHSAPLRGTGRPRICS